MAPQGLRLTLATAALPSAHSKQQTTKEIYEALSKLIDGDFDLQTEFNKAMPSSYQIKTARVKQRVKKEEMQKFFATLSRERPDLLQKFMAFLGDIQKRGE